MKTKTYNLIKNFKQPGCIVLGISNIAGLSIVRSLGVKKIPVIGIANSRLEIGVFSKYCLSVEIFSKEEELLYLLEEIGKTSVYKNVIFCEHDIFLLFVEKNREHLEKYFHLLLPEKMSLNGLMNKKDMVKLAQASGVGVPLTFFSDEVLLDEIKNKMIYPSIVKPLYSQYNQSTKCDVINDEEELNGSIKKDRYRTGYVIQEVIEGKEDKIWVCGGYCNSNTEFLGLFTGHKYRQLPKLFGSTTLGVSQRNTAVMEMAMTFLKHIGYQGCFSFEAKQRGDEYKFIETNFRICFWNEMARSSGINLPYIAYCDVVGLPCEGVIKQKDGIIWISILDDFITCFKHYSRDSKFIFIDWIKNVFGANSYAVFELTDIPPFLVKMLKILLKIRD
ncbi:hypothetical protein ACFL2J_01500 [Candidatus Omnitrophota bacterium]